MIVHDTESTFERNIKDSTHYPGDLFGSTIPSRLLLHTDFFASVTSFFVPLIVHIRS